MRNQFAFQDSPELFGIFGMKVYDVRNGKRICVRRVLKKNQITNQGRRALLELMRPVTFGVNQTIRQIFSLSVGTNSTPPTINDDDATMAQVWRNELVLSECEVVATAPNLFLLQIGKILPETDAVGQVLTEAGIFTRGTLADPYTSADRWLYARQTHPPITKTITMLIEYNWKLGVSIQGA